MGRRNDLAQKEQLQKHNINEIDLLMINLYKFKETLQNTTNSFEIIENIDIGGPAMIRAGAKNHEFVTVVTDPKDYSKLIKQIKIDKKTTYTFRKYLAGKAIR